MATLGVKGLSYESKESYALVKAGDRAFPVAASRACNALPDFVTAAPIVSSFCIAMNYFYRT